MRFVIKNILKVALLSYVPLSLLITDNVLIPQNIITMFYICLMHNQNNIHNTVH